MEDEVVCPICGFAATDLRGLASHMVEQAEASEGYHVMWLNRNATKRRTSPADLEGLLATALSGGTSPADRLKR